MTVPSKRTQPVVTNAEVEFDKRLIDRLDLGWQYIAHTGMFTTRQGNPSSLILMHVSLDFWNTLYVSNKEFKSRRLNLLSNASGKSELEVARCVSTIGCWHNDSLMANHNMAIPSSALNELLFQSLGIVDREHPSLMESIYSIFLEHPPHRMHHPTVERHLELASTMSLLSNTTFIPGKVIRELNERTEWNFSFELYSDEMGTGKPAERPFQLLLEKVKRLAPASDVIHIGDNPNFDRSPIPSVKSIILT